MNIREYLSCFYNANLSSAPCAATPSTRLLRAQGTFELSWKDENKLRTAFHGSSSGSHICIVNKATNLCRLDTPSHFADTNFRLIGNRRATCQLVLLASCPPVKISRKSKTLLVFVHVCAARICISTCFSVVYLA